MHDRFPLAPWLPPAEPDLARLAWDAADREGLGSLRGWPEVHKGGIAFGGLPPFLSWRGQDGGGWQLVLLQPRELGALVPGARVAPLPEGWLEALALEDLARPLVLHPDFPGGTSLQVAQLPHPGLARVRTAGRQAPELVGAVLARLTGREDWEVVAP